MWDYSQNQIKHELYTDSLWQRGLLKHTHSELSQKQDYPKLSSVWRKEGRKEGIKQTLQSPHSHPICSSNPTFKEKDKFHIISNEVSFTVILCILYTRDINWIQQQATKTELFMHSILGKHIEFLFSGEVQIS